MQAKGHDAVLSGIVRAQQEHDALHNKYELVNYMLIKAKAKARSCPDASSLIH